MSDATEVKPDTMRRVAIVGEIPFAGCALIKALHAAGLLARVLCPDAQASAALAQLAQSGCTLEIVEGDLGSQAAVSATLKDAYSVCFLSPITMAGRIYRPHTHLVDVRMVVQAAEEHALRKLIYHSSLGVDKNAASQALRDSAAAEELVDHTRGEDFRVRSGPLMGLHDGFLSALAGPATSPSFVMKMLGYGSTLVQPIHVDDFAQCLVRLLTAAHEEFKPGAYNLGGPELVTLLDLVDTYLELAHRSKLKIHVPLFVLKALTALKKDKQFTERVALLFDSFASDHNDAPSLLGTRAAMLSPRHTQEEILRAGV